MSIFSKQFRDHWQLYAFIFPILLYFVIFVFYPLAQGIWMSFQKMGLLGPMGFIGQENYRIVFTDPTVIQSTISTIVIAASITIFGFALPILPAIAIHEITRITWKRLFQTIIYMPYLFSWVIIIGIWMNLLSPIGLVNSILVSIGLLDIPISFFSSPNFARTLLVAQTVWKDLGFNAVIYLAAIVSINPELYEAAEIDGASVFHKIRYIILPHIYPAMQIVFLITLVGSLRTFDSSYLMTNGMTADKITTLAMLIYERGLLEFDLGVASAAGVLLLVISILFALTASKIVGYK